ncbi:trypsin beta isoform X1 [Drosophila elegans]|uniref:trypsin beta isoform X1 n=1 Tax=Drosophila elegans TaxID=30023 RepID=UPI0007E61A5A|nr:trypsin beta isoform X1 [Drosophila elegans]
MFFGYCIVLILLSRGTTGIQNGVDARLDLWTFIASVWVNGHQECGGSVIDNRIILTAAQCVKGIPVKNLTIRVGTSDLYKGGTIIEVTAMIVHEKYRELNNDIALLWLKTSATSDRVTKIPLTNSEPSEKEYPSNAGWGEKQLETFVAPRKLQNGVTKIQPRKLCIDELIEPIGNGLLCSFYSQNDICPGDYGGPLVLANKLIGIAVQGHGCGYANLPSLYTNVFHYLRWIDQNSKNIKKNK